MKSKAAGCGSISTVISSIVLLCVSSIVIIIISNNSNNDNNRLIKLENTKPISQLTFCKSFVYFSMILLVPFYFKNSVRGKP